MESEEDQEDIRLSIKRCRDRLFEERGICACSKSILLDNILQPILAHGSHLIYAPDDFLFTLYGHYNKCKANGERMLKWPTYAHIKGFMLRNIYFIIVVVVCISLFFAFQTQVICFIETYFLGWAAYNRDLGADFGGHLMRFGNITVLMVIRLLVSNVLPPTSPAFAYLIGRSQAPGQGWAGTLYLLVCSMPAGMIVPSCDKLVFSFLSQKQKSDIDNHFLATNFLSRITDYLPFSFWVRPLMEQAFRVAHKVGEAADHDAAAAAVLGGHFMIWSGPATTMHQRKFVPDWWTCIFIQPLGLMEDVAIVLATWAGESASSQRSAEISLYFFMLLMNGVRANVVNKDLITRRDGHSARYARHRFAALMKKFRNAVNNEHVVVMLLTVVAIVIRYLYGNPVLEAVLPSSTSITTTTTTTTGECTSEATNTKVMLFTAAWVSFLAVLFRMCARVVTYWFQGETVTEMGKPLCPVPDDATS
jgi:hypothetical protein